MPKLDLVWLTNRLEPKFEWFVDSLAHQARSEEVALIAVDFHADKHERRDQFKRINADRFEMRHVTPMPSVWQGKHRLTKADYFAAANASNTGIALCRSEHVAFIDDVSVLQPGWWECVKEAVERPGITCGSYKKVNNLVVQNGMVQSFTEFPPGNDRRIAWSNGATFVQTSGKWFYGCSFVAPIEELLKINGFDHDCDSMGYQDVVAGEMLDRWGTPFTFDTRMMTWESEDLHYDNGGPFLRWDPGTSPEDKSHCLLSLVHHGRNAAPNYFGSGGLRKLREQMRYADGFPIYQEPTVEWFTGKPIKELPE